MTRNPRHLHLIHDVYPCQHLPGVRDILFSVSRSTADGERNASAGTGCSDARPGQDHRSSRSRWFSPPLHKIRSVKVGNARINARLVHRSFRERQANVVSTARAAAHKERCSSCAQLRHGNRGLRDRASIAPSRSARRAGARARVGRVPQQLPATLCHPFHRPMVNSVERFTNGRIEALPTHA